MIISYLNVILLEFYNQDTAANVSLYVFYSKTVFNDNLVASSACYNCLCLLTILFVISVA